MKINKISYYIFYQIAKNFLLILFIFLSIAWLLQITRLFTITNFIQLNIMNVIYLSIYLIPNIITIIVPFILIFGLLLCFIKLNSDKELVAILTIGLGLNPIKNTLVFFSIIIILIFSILSFYIAPKIYEKYKFREYELRNIIDINNMSFSNFLNLDGKTILDFEKNNNQFINIFISFEDDKENIIFAKKGNIFNEDSKYNFQLSDGFKISIDNNKQIEKLEFTSYILKIENQNKNTFEIFDKNTLTIFDDFNSKNYLNIIYKIMDIVIIIYILVFFYYNSLKKINFNYKNNIFFSLSSVSILVINQILKNSEILIISYSIIMLSLILLSFLILKLKGKYE